ncbi:carbamoyltransferase [Geobacter sp. DSM 9736]|uniref:carbamoyltransferase family protein n=1 Tax=Geobacter sp. DSM 9736 TaxID=1277350 RepID=UPI000B50F497|nr:carbamoyltransferase [Geobacter sp. DSM 9736]SNB46628.1 carbamoyltransferase [Geobacter sp. DSM 9736]
MKNKLILGISAYYHDSAAAVIEDGRIAYAVHEERLTRKKQDSSFPLQSIKASLDFLSQEKGRRVFLSDFDAIVFYDKPLLKFERILETYYAFAPRGLKQFLAAMPVWAKEKLFIKKMIYDGLAKIEPGVVKDVKLLFSEHHLSHAASAFYPSPFREAAIVTIDGVGEWATATIAHGKGREITMLKEQHFPHSVGLLYSAFTYFTGFKVNSGEYKLMGLAPYGDPTSDRTRRYIDAIYGNIIDMKADGSVWLNQDYFNYAVGLSMVNDEKWEKLFGFPRREPESELTQECCDLAYAIQQIIEDAVLRMAKEATRLTGSNNLCMAGGVALNCVANGKLLRAGIIDDLWIQPAAGDAGGALGAALAAYHGYFEAERTPPNCMDHMNGAYLGPEYDELDVGMTIRSFGAIAEKLDDEALYDRVADLIASGNVVGWFQGRMEWGPRALGNRSILADARSPQMQKKLNLKIKYREGFRPFAPSVLAEDAALYFERGDFSPYMLLIDYVREDRRNTLPNGYHQLPLKEKLYFLRSDIPSITHLDFSARVQTVHHETNPRYHSLIKRFKQKTGYGVIVNTSFNVRGEPIVCTPKDAYICFMRTEMDYLVLGNFLMAKERQPVWEEQGDWREQYGLD